MASIDASTSGAGGIITTADNTGTLNLQSGGATIATVSSTGLSLATGKTLSVGGATGSPFSMKNRIINGDMVINQRNPGTVTLDTNSRFFVDRFLGEDDSDATVTAVQSTTAPSGFANSLLFTVTTADSSIGASQNCTLRHWIEGYNVADLGWGTANAKTVTLSFWVRSSVTGTHSASLLNSDGSRSYVFTYTISTANTWEQKSITISGDTTGTWLTTNGRGIGIYWNLGAGSTFLGSAGSWGSSLLLGATGSVQLISTVNATFYITGVQLEVGSSATSFEWLPYTTELLLCQRYYETFGRGVVGGSTSTTQWFGGVTFRAVKRANPSVSQGAVMDVHFPAVGIKTQSSTNITQAYTDLHNGQVTCVNFSGLTAHQTGIIYGPTNNALIFDCEL